MSVERNIRFDLIARLCPNTTGAELRSVATEAGMFAIRARRKVATERDFLDAVEKVVRQGTKFSSTYAQSPPSSYHNPATNIGFTGPCIKCITRLVVVSRMSYILSLCYRTLRALNLKLCAVVCNDSGFHCGNCNMEDEWTWTRS